jgi:hypothetical protein
MDIEWNKDERDKIEVHDNDKIVQESNDNLDSE